MPPDEETLGALDMDSEWRDRYIRRMQTRRASRATETTGRPATSDPILAWLDTVEPMMDRHRAAELVGVSYRTIDRALASGALRGIKTGIRQVRISRDALRAWLMAGI